MKEIDIEMRVTMFELAPREVRVNLDPRDPFAIIVNGIVIVARVCSIAHHYGRIIESSRKRKVSESARSAGASSTMRFKVTILRI